MPIYKSGGSLFIAGAIAGALLGGLCSWGYFRDQVGKGSARPQKIAYGSSTSNMPVRAQRSGEVKSEDAERKRDRQKDIEGLLREIDGLSNEVRAISEKYYNLVKWIVEGKAYPPYSRDYYKNEIAALLDDSVISKNLLIDGRIAQYLEMSEAQVCSLQSLLSRAKNDVEALHRGRMQIQESCSSNVVLHMVGSIEVGDAIRRKLFADIQSLLGQTRGELFEIFCGERCRVLLSDYGMTDKRLRFSIVQGDGGSGTQAFRISEQLWEGDGALGRVITAATLPDQYAQYLPWLPYGFSQINTSPRREQEEYSEKSNNLAF